MASAPETIPGVHRPPSDVLFVLAMYCARTAQPMDSAKTATQTEMSTQFGSFRRTIRKTEDTA